MLPAPLHHNPADKRWYSYYQTADRLISAYSGEEPFAAYLKKYFAAQKKHGSSDRKNIAALCYGFFRLGLAADKCTRAAAWQAGIFLGSHAAAASSLLPASWQEQLPIPLAEKIKWIRLTLPQFDLKQIFPLRAHLSPEIDQESFLISHLVQPDLFLRIRPGYRTAVEEKLRQAGIDAMPVSEDAIAVSNHTAVDKYLELDKEVVVQDLSSQQVGQFFQHIRWESKAPKKVWDCCAASGGKSLLALDRIKKIELTVSDIRSSVLANLNKRLAKAGWKNYTQLEVDLTKTTPHLPQQQLIICDAPCSGSGTWGRTPEHIRFFTEARIRQFTEKQQAILTHILPLIERGGYLLYITCSVFREENEDIIAWLLEQVPLELVSQQLLKGYERKSDTLFGALLRKK